MSKPASSGSIPPLRNSDGSWSRSAAEKANLLGQSFAAKWRLPDLSTNFYTPPDLPCRTPERFLQLRSRSAYRILTSLDRHSSTGPDLLSATILKFCASAMYIPFVRLARRIVDCSQWPKTWKVHWVHPLHKRLSRSEPDHYRGIQLTAQISKAMERFIGIHFIGQLSVSGDVGERQFAYRKQYGARDALLFFVTSCLIAFATGHKVGTYCSDVSSAFDRVSEVLFRRKLNRSSIPQNLVSLIINWLRDRRASVIVGGEHSNQFTMADMLFQGTVWGPILWNLFFPIPHCH